MLKLDGSHVRFFGRRGKADGQLEGPSSIAIDVNGEVGIADQSGHIHVVFRVVYVCMCVCLFVCVCQCLTEIMCDRMD